MELPEAPYRHIEGCVPTPRGHVTLDTLPVLNAILYVAEQGCQWRGLPNRFGNGHPISARRNQWAKSGVLDRVFAPLQQAQILRLRLEAVAGDSPLVKVHPEGTGTFNNPARTPSAGRVVGGPPRFIWLPRMLEQP